MNDTQITVQWWTILIQLLAVFCHNTYVNLRVPIFQPQNYSGKVLPAGNILSSSLFHISCPMLQRVFEVCCPVRDIFAWHDFHHSSSKTGQNNFYEVRKAVLPVLSSKILRTSSVPNTSLRCHIFWQAIPWKNSHTLKSPPKHNQVEVRHEQLCQREGYPAEQGE